MHVYAGDANRLKRKVGQPQTDTSINPEFYKHEGISASSETGIGHKYFDLRVIYTLSQKHFINTNFYFPDFRRYFFEKMNIM
jgi:hypothetical protein